MRKLQTNKRIREELKARSLAQWQLADLLGVSTDTVTRKLRHELPKEEQDRIIDLIRSAEERS